MLIFIQEPFRGDSSKFEGEFTDMSFIANTLAAANQVAANVSYQAALNSDGTSNGAINSLVSKAGFVMSSVVVLVFLIRSGIQYAQGKKAKEILSESTAFAVVLAFIVGATIIVNVVTAIVQGVGGQ